MEFGAETALFDAAVFCNVITALNEKNHPADWVLEFTLKSTTLNDLGVKQLDKINVTLSRYGGITASDLQEIMSAAEYLKGELILKGGDVNVTFGN